MATERTRPGETPGRTTLAETDLETLRPAPDWDAAAHADAVETLGTAGLTYHVWTADWCPDCREQVPAFAAALDAAGVDPSGVHVYPVERDDDGKYGPGMETFDVSLIPTVVVERDGEELARFEESAPRPLVVALAAALADATE